MLTCKRMRTAVLTSALLLVVGLVLGTVAGTTAWILPTSHLALFTVLAGAAVLALTFFASLMPGTAKRLTECQH